MKRLFTSLAVSAILSSAIAGTFPVTYNFNDAEPTGYRKFKSKPEHDSETIDVAVYIDGLMAGMRVTSISVPIEGYVDGLSDFSAFITTKLATRSQGALKFNSPDVCSVEASVEGSVLTATFPEPYTITENGVYVGYSITDNTMEAKPVAVVEGAHKDSFWYRGSEANAKWGNFSLQTGLSSAMTVNLEGELPAVGVAVGDVSECNVAINETGSADVRLINVGVDKVKSLDYTVSLDGSDQSYSISFSPEVPAKALYPFAAALELPATTTLGGHDVKITIDKVNGQANATTGNRAEFKLEAYPFVPKNRPLVEEYTGLDCGWCPGGYVMLRQMHDKYGIEDFVAISYHMMLETGCMVHLDEYPYYPSGIPAAQINRGAKVDIEDLPGKWNSTRKKIADGEIEVDLKWADADKTEMTATSRSRFINDSEVSPYLVSYCVVADGMWDPTWVQYNAYGDENMADEQKSKCTGDYWDLFIGEDVGMHVAGLVFDEIAVLYPDQKGVAGSLPEQVAAGEWYESSFSFKPAEILNVVGEHVIKDHERLRVIAMIVDSKSGEVINSASSFYADGTGAVDSIDVESGESAPVYYDLQGRRLANPGHGLFIKVESGKATKIML